MVTTRAQSAPAALKTTNSKSKTRKVSPATKKKTVPSVKKKAVLKSSSTKSRKTNAGVKNRAVPEKKAGGRVADIEGVFKRQCIPFYTAGDIEYERSVQSSNLLYRFSRPHWVVLPENPVHVQKVVKQAKFREKAREKSLAVSDNGQSYFLTIKNGGHSYSGSSSTEQGILLDLKNMNKVHLDLQSETMTLQGGAVWGHAYKTFINNRLDGLIINGGRCPNVGVSGYLLGGGIGPFGRSFGMGCDDLKEVTIVTADGRLVTVKDSDNPKSAKGLLFWALCGAGGGNFGVVVELKMGIHRLRTKDGIVVAGRYTWYPTEEEKTTLLSTMNGFYATEWPDQITIDSSWFCDLQQKGGGLGIRFLTYYDGHADEFQKQIKKLLKHEELATQLTRRSLPEKSTRFLHETLVSMWDEETRSSLPLNTSYRIYSSFVFQRDPAISNKVTAIIKAELARFKHTFKGENGLCQVSFIHSGGQASRKPRSATAFRWREAIWHTYIMLQWNDKWLERDMRSFCKCFKARLRPFSLEGQAAFINFPDGSLRPDIHEKAYYGNNRQGLQQIKSIWDPDNFFNWPQGIHPSSLDRQSPLISPRAVAEQGAMAIEEQDDQVDDGEFSADEEALTDVIAGRQWDTQTSRATNDFDWLGIHGIPYKWWSNEEHET